MKKIEAHPKQPQKKGTTQMTNTKQQPKKKTELSLDDFKAKILGIRHDATILANDVQELCTDSLVALELHRNTSKIALLLNEMKQTEVIRVHQLAVYFNQATEQALSITLSPEGAVEVAIKQVHKSKKAKGQVTAGKPITIDYNLRWFDVRTSKDNKDSKVFDTEAIFKILVGLVKRANDNEIDASVIKKQLERAMLLA